MNKYQEHDCIEHGVRGTVHNLENGPAEWAAITKDEAARYLQTHMHTRHNIGAQGTESAK